jgi:hypothetical protein
MWHHYSDEIQIVTNSSQMIISDDYGIFGDVRWTSSTITSLLVWLIWLSYLEVYMLQVYSDEGFHEHWRPLDWLSNHFKAWGLLCYTHHSVFFKNGRCRIKIDPQLESATQLKARGYSIWSATLQLHFHIISTSRPMSWTTFQPRGSSSTIEDFSKQYSRTLKNYSNRPQDYSNYYSQLQRARGFVRHTPRYSYKEGWRRTPTRIPL